MSNMKNDMDLNEKMTAAADKNGDLEKQPEKKRMTSRKGIRWTVVDTVILLMVLLALAGIVARGFIRNHEAGDSQPTTPYYVDFTIREIHRTVLSEIEAEDAVYLYSTDILMGYIGKYDNGIIALRETGLVADKNGYVTAEGCLVCLDATYRDGGLLIEGTETYLAPGTIAFLRTDRVVFEVEITNVRS